jgi:hypothetical protein
MARRLKRCSQTVSSWIKVVPDVELLYSTILREYWSATVVSSLVVLGYGRPVVFLLEKILVVVKRYKMSGQSRTS